VAVATAIAVEGLMGNIATVRNPRDDSLDKEYLLAGGRQYRSLWARDFGMSVGGALAIGQTGVVRDSLEILLGFQRDDGLLPRIVDNWSLGSRFALAFLGVPPGFSPPFRGWFETENNVIAIDGNAILPWAASRYVLATRDRAFAQRWFPAVERTLAFLQRQFVSGGLIGGQPPFSDWADSVRREGHVAFTNELYLLALKGAAQWAAFLGRKDRAAFYEKEAGRFKEKFLAYFWDPDRRILRNFENDDRLTADANLMAVAYGILDRADALAVIRTLKKTPLWDPLPGRPTWPDYPETMKSRLVRMVGLTGYHDEMYWLWITALAAQAERAVGHCDGYKSLVGALATKIQEDGVVSEVYELKGKGPRLEPVIRLLYRSEEPFTWSSAMFLEAATGGCEIGVESPGRDG
jgi:GH15 family glucan-1,4-alpha-glucosidase